MSKPTSFPKDRKVEKTNCFRREQVDRGLYLYNEERQESGSTPGYDRCGELDNREGEKLDGIHRSGRITGEWVFVWLEKSDWLLAWCTSVDPRISLWCLGVCKALLGYHLFHTGVLNNLVQSLLV